MGQVWQRHEAERRIAELLDAARNQGPQTVEDPNGGEFKIEFVEPRQSLEELFSKPGPLLDRDLDP